MKPSKQFYKKLVCYWFKFLPWLKAGASIAEFKSYVVEEFKKRNEWKEEFSKPVEAFIQILCQEYQKALTRSREIDSNEVSVSEFLAYAKAELHSRWENEIVTRSQGFTGKP